MKNFGRVVLKGMYNVFRCVYRVLPVPHSIRAAIRRFIINASVKVYRDLSGNSVPHMIATLEQNKESIKILENHIKDCEQHIASCEQHIASCEQSIRIYKQRVDEYEQQVDEYERYVHGIAQIGKKSTEFVEYRNNSIKFDEDDVKPIALYLTQFHTIPENDEWWGKGFTEWTNVTKATPLFPGHYQPHLPLETFYDLSGIDVMKKQVELAKNYGIYGFCFHYYWYSGRRLLEKPLESYLNTKEGLDFPFCINWANHSWTRVWDASENEILIEQKYSEADDLACIADICRYFNDERYIRINGKPLVSIYSQSHMPDPNRTIEIWRDYCKKNGFGEIHVIGMDSDTWNPMVYDFDGGVASAPHDINNYFSEMFHKTTVAMKNLAICNIKDIEKYVREKPYLNDGRDNLYRGIITSFDNTARRSDIVHAISVTPELYKEWLLDILQSSKKNFETGNRLVFINAWNEWAEGMHLEPDRKYGYAYLQATVDAVLESRGK